MEIVELQILDQCEENRTMTLKDFREDYHKVTAKASDLARSTNYSLIAIVWVICGQDIEKVASYQNVLMFLLLSLTMDYLQYWIMALIGIIKYRSEEMRVKDKKKLDEENTGGYPAITPYISSACFLFKFIFTLVAVSILIYKLV